jgi:hypothetical protein
VLFHRLYPPHRQGAEPFGPGPTRETDEQEEILSGEAINPPKMEKADYAIIPADKTREWLQVFQGQEAFTPEETDIERSESLFRSRFFAMDGYYRQYFGVRNEKGQREIHLRAFRKDMEKDYATWQTDVFIVMDGGDDFYDGAVNLDEDRLLYVAPHGEV